MKAIPHLVDLMNTCPTPVYIPGVLDNARNGLVMYRPNANTIIRSYTLFSDSLPTVQPDLLHRQKQLN